MKRRYWFLIVIFPLICGIMYVSRGVLMPFGVAFFLAYAMNPLVEWIQNKGARRDFAILTVYFVFVVVAVLILGSILPRLASDLSRAMHRLPLVLHGLDRMGQNLERLTRNLRLPFDVGFLTSEFEKRGGILARGFLIQIGEGLIGLLSQSFFVLLIPLLSYYISRDYPKIKTFLLQWLLQYFGPHWTRTFLKIDAVLRLYIRSNLCVTLIVGALIGLGLYCLGFEAAFLLGLIAGAFNLIPYFGPVLGVIPAIVFALVKSPWLALYVILLFIFVNQVETLFLTPRIVGSKLGLHPIAVVYLVLLGGKFGGILGMVFAVPVGALCLVILRSIYEICFEIPCKEQFGEKRD